MTTVSENPLTAAADSVIPGPESDEHDITADPLANSHEAKEDGATAGDGSPAPAKKGVRFAAEDEENNDGDGAVSTEFMSKSTTKFADKRKLSQSYSRGEAAYIGYLGQSMFQKFHGTYRMRHFVLGALITSMVLCIPIGLTLILFVAIPLGDATKTISGGWVWIFFVNPIIMTTFAHSHVLMFLGSLDSVEPNRSFISYSPVATVVYLVQICVGCTFVLTVGYFNWFGIVCFVFMIASLAIGMRIQKPFLLKRADGSYVKSHSCTLMGLNEPGAQQGGLPVSKSLVDLVSKSEIESEMTKDTDLEKKRSKISSSSSESSSENVTQQIEDVKSVSGEDSKADEQPPSYGHEEEAKNQKRDSKALSGDEEPNNASSSTSVQETAEDHVHRRSSVAPDAQFDPASKPWMNQSSKQDSSCVCECHTGAQVGHKWCKCSQTHWHSTYIQYVKCLLLFVVYLVILTAWIIAYKAASKILQQILVICLTLVSFISKKTLLAFTVPFPLPIAMLMAGYWVEHLTDCFYVMAYPRVDSPGLSYSVFFLSTIAKNIFYLGFQTDKWFHFRLWIKSYLKNGFKNRTWKAKPEEMEEILVDDIEDHGTTNNKPAYHRRQTVFFVYKLLSQIFATFFYMILVSALRYTYNSDFYPFSSDAYTAADARVPDRAVVSDDDYRNSMIFAAVNLLFLIGTCVGGAKYIEHNNPAAWDSVTSMWRESFNSRNFWGYLIILSTSNYFICLYVFMYQYQIWF